MIVTILISGWIGWRCGMRDGITLAHCDVAIPVSRYHQAKAEGRTRDMDAAIEELTITNVGFLLDGDHSFPLFGTIPGKPQAALRSLRAVWTPLSSYSYIGGGSKYPHQSSKPHKYKEFEAIEPEMPMKRR